MRMVVVQVSVKFGKEGGWVRCVKCLYMDGLDNEKIKILINLIFFKYLE